VYQQIIVSIYQLCQAVGLAVSVLSVTCRAYSTIDNATSIHKLIQINLGFLLELLFRKNLGKRLVKKMQNIFLETAGFLTTKIELRRT
jgi:hypothetical protein